MVAVVFTSPVRYSGSRARDTVQYRNVNTSIYEFFRILLAFLANVELYYDSVGSVLHVVHKRDSHCYVYAT